MELDACSSLMGDHLTVPENAGSRFPRPGKQAGKRGKRGGKLRKTLEKLRKGYGKNIEKSVENRKGQKY